MDRCIHIFFKDQGLRLAKPTLATHSFFNCMGSKRVISNTCSRIQLDRKTVIEKLRNVVGIDNLLCSPNEDISKYTTGCAFFILLVHYKY